MLHRHLFCHPKPSTVATEELKESEEQTSKDMKEESEQK